jgi:hypothetical protein
MGKAILLVRWTTEMTERDKRSSLVHDLIAAIKVFIVKAPSKETITVGDFGDFWPLSWSKT